MPELSPISNLIPFQDQHPEWLKRSIELRLASSEIDDDETTLEQITDAILELERLVATTHARSLKGAISKLELLLLHQEPAEGQQDILTQALQTTRRTMLELIE